MKNLGMTMKLDPHGDKITCPAFGLYPSPAEYSTLGHVVLDLTILGFQPKSRERSAHPRRNGTFAMSERNIACPAHTRDLEVMKMISLLQEKCDPAADHRNPRKGPPVWRDPSATLEQDASGTSREGVNTIHPEPEIHEQIYMTKGYGTLCTTTSTFSPTLSALWTIV